MSDIDESPYCEECGSCGETGCCNPLWCAQKNMLDNGCGKYCDTNFEDLAFMYHLAEALFEKYTDNEVFDQVFKKVFPDVE